MLTLQVERDGDVTTIRVAGEVDMATAPQLAECVDDVIGSGAAKVVIDCADLEFMDSTGINVLIRAWDAMRDRASMPVVVTNLRPNVQRALEVCGVTDLLTE